MRTQKIDFPDQQPLCVFPSVRSSLQEAILTLGLKGNCPVVVLIGGEIEEQQADAIQRAIQTICRVAEEKNAIIICGGTDMGIMAEAGRVRWRNQYQFPLVGIAPADLVTWPGGPHSGKFLGWGEKRLQLEHHYSHFILIPGRQFGDESPWILDTATILSKERQSVTVLINGGKVSRKDIDLSLKMGRPVIALSRTGGMADEVARQPNRHRLITVIPSNAEKRIAESIHAALLGIAFAKSQYQA